MEQKLHLKNVSKLLELLEFGQEKWIFELSWSSTINTFQNKF